MDAKGSQAVQAEAQHNTITVHESRTPNRDKIVTGTPTATSVPCAFSSPIALAPRVGLYPRSKARVTGRWVVRMGQGKLGRGAQKQENATTHTPPHAQSNEQVGMDFCTYLVRTSEKMHY